MHNRLKAAIHAGRPFIGVDSVHDLIGPKFRGEGSVHMQNMRAGTQT